MWVTEIYHHYSLAASSVPRLGSRGQFYRGVGEYTFPCLSIWVMTLLSVCV